MTSGSSTRRSGGQKVRALPRKFVYLGFGREEPGTSQEFCRDVEDHWGGSKSQCKNCPTPSRAGTTYPFPLPKEVQKGGVVPAGRGVAARRGVGVPARGVLQPIRGQEAWEYHEPGPPKEPGPLAFSQPGFSSTGLPLQPNSLPFVFDSWAPEFLISNTITVAFSFIRNIFIVGTQIIADLEKCFLEFVSVNLLIFLQNKLLESVGKL